MVSCYTLALAFLRKYFRIAFDGDFWYNFGMGIEDINLIGFKELLAKYDGRIDMKDEMVEALPLVIPNRLEVDGKLKNFAGNVFLALKDKTFDSSDGVLCDGLVVASRTFEQSDVIDSDIPLTIRVQKICEYNRKTQQYINSYKFSLYKYDGVPSRELFFTNVPGLRVLDFRIEEFSDGTCGLPHRIVDPEYRGCGLGDVIAKMSDSVMQMRVNEQQEENQLDVETSQLDVIVWLLKNGFVPSSKMDEAKLQKVLDADDSLAIEFKYYIFPASIPVAERINVDRDSFRIRFVKNFIPKNNEAIDKLNRSTKDDVSEVVTT